MKTFTKSIATLLTITLLAINLAVSQTPPPPNNNQGAPGSGNTPVGGGAPIGSGLLILLGLGVAYGGKKVFDIKKHRLAE